MRSLTSCGERSKGFPPIVNVTIGIEETLSQSTADCWFGFGIWSQSYKKNSQSLEFFHMFLSKTSLQDSPQQHKRVCVLVFDSETTHSASTHMPFHRRCTASFRRPETPSSTIDFIPILKTEHESVFSLLTNVLKTSFFLLNYVLTSHHAYRQNRRVLSVSIPSSDPNQTNLLGVLNITKVSFLSLHQYNTLFHSGTFTNSYRAFTGKGGRLL